MYRAFRTALRVIVGDVTLDGADPAIILTHLLREAAVRRLVEVGVRPKEADVLASSEPKLGTLARLPGVGTDHGHRRPRKW